MFFFPQHLIHPRTKTKKNAFNHSEIECFIFSNRPPPPKRRRVQWLSCYFFPAVFLTFRKQSNLEDSPPRPSEFDSGRSDGITRLTHCSTVGRNCCCCSCWPVSWRNPGPSSVTCPDAGAVLRGKSLSSSVGWGFVQSSGQSYQSHESIKYMVDPRSGSRWAECGIFSEIHRGLQNIGVSLDFWYLRNLRN